MNDIVRATFDGLTFSLVADDGDIPLSVPAVSGRPLAQNPNFQSIRNFGPLPEGEYVFSTAEPAFWRRGDYEVQIRGEEDWGAAWGNFRVALRPDGDSDIYGRGDFYLHGSLAQNGYGSAGCIDLGLNDESVFNLIRESSASEIVLTVNYSDELRTKFHTVYADYQDLEGLLTTLESGGSSWPGIDRDQLLEGGFRLVFVDEVECFPSTTVISKVLGGSSLTIGQLRVFDLILAFDPTADQGRGALVPRKVTRLYRNTTTEWLRLTWEEDGEAKELVTTPGHHFLDRHGRFTRIDRMLKDNRATIVLANGTLTEVRAERILYSTETANQFERAVAFIDTGDGTAAKPGELDCWPRWRFVSLGHYSLPYCPLVDRLR